MARCIGAALLGALLWVGGIAGEAHPATARMGSRPLGDRIVAMGAAALAGPHAPALAARPPVAALTPKRTGADRQSGTSDPGAAAPAGQPHGIEQRNGARARSLRASAVLSVAVRATYDATAPPGRSLGRI